MEEEFTRQGLLSYMDENYKTAIDQFSKALEKNPDNYDVIIFRGCSFSKLGDYSTALSDFNTAEKLKEIPDFDLLYNRGKTHFLNQDFKQAHEDLSKANELNDINPSQKEKVTQILNRIS
jgi:Flp pilus assembly protein TadD